MRGGRQGTAEQPSSSGSSSGGSGGVGGGGGHGHRPGTRGSGGPALTGSRRSLLQPQLPTAMGSGSARAGQATLAPGHGAGPGPGRQRGEPLGQQGSSVSLRSDEARMRELAELQRQLEGLQQATASLQAAVSHAADRPALRPGSGQAAAGSRRSSGSAARRSAAAAAAEAAEAGEEDDEAERMAIHPHVTCDGCGAGPPLVGRVMKCLDCEDFDFCSQCFNDPERTGHPRGHRFRPRSGREGRMASPQLLLRILESTMLSEALRRSTEGEAANEGAEQDAAEVRAAEVLSALPRVRWEASTEACSECALCLEEYSPGEEVLKLPCGHFFHESCVGPWFAKSLLCPLCQQDASA